MKEKQPFMTTIWGSLLKAFLGGCLTVYLSNGHDVFDYTESMWKGLIGAGVSAVAMTAYSFFNKNDPRFGVQSKKTSEIVDKKDI